jgi:putative ABC transport system substrate-binding protein
MNGKLIGLALSALFVSLGLPAGAQQTGKIRRIGFLDRSRASSAVHVDAFRERLSNLGWTEGESITIEYRLAEGKTDRLLSLRRSWFVSRW